MTARNRLIGYYVVEFEQHGKDRAAYGQTFLEDVHLSLSKGFEGVYAKGDTVKVYAEVAKETPAVVKIYQNGYFKEAREICLPAGKSEFFSGAYNEASALMFRLANPANPKDSTTLGAIVSPEDFRPGFDEPKDWRKFWRKQVKQVRKQKMEVKLAPVSIPGRDSLDYVCYDLEVNCITARPVRGYLALPRSAAPHSLPIAIKAHGAGKFTDSKEETSNKTDNQSYTRSPGAQSGSKGIGDNRGLF